MRTIICYRRGCSNRAQWVLPGQQPIHLCTTHLRELLPNQVLTVQQIVVGPTEFKEELEDEDGKNTRAA